jgi:transposase InsO family protein
MKSDFPHIAMAKLCGWFGITRQAYYQQNQDDIQSTIEEELIIQEVRDIREKHPRMGGRKLYHLLLPFMQEHSIKMGRDALFTMLSENHLLVRKRKRIIRTTNSYHRFKKYPNLIRNFIATAPNQLWVSDITYWKINTQKHVYISFITDVYSHKIVGCQVAETLAVVETIQALNMALLAIGPTRPVQLVHHSDRGFQYCNPAYVKLLEDYKIGISMTENSDPLENALAERINGIVKEEYLNAYKVNTIKEAKSLLTSVIELYNNERPHMSIGNLKPNQVHQSNVPIVTKRLWKNYYQKHRTFVNQS